VVFWMVVMGLTFAGMTRFCIGANCGIGVIIGLMSLLNS
jgi:hypothetical protein